MPPVETQRRISKVGRLVVLTDASVLPHRVVTTLLKRDGELVRELKRYLVDGEAAAELQRLVDAQHYGLVQRLEHRAAEPWEVSCTSCQATIAVALAAEADGEIVLVSCPACGAGFVAEGAALRSTGRPRVAAAPAPAEPEPELVAAEPEEAAAPEAPPAAALDDAWEPAAEPPAPAPESSLPPIYLRVVEGKDLGHIHAWNRVRLAVGRGDAEIVLNDLRISRRHAEFEVRRELDALAFYVRDLGSTNGSFLNEVRITQARRITHGDRVRVGKSVLEFHVDEEGVPDDLAGALAAEQVAEGPVVESPPALLHETKIYLDVIQGVDRDRSYEFSRERVLLGRGDANVVLNDTKVSRRHAEIELIGGYTPVLRDLSSANGSFVNERRVEDTVELKDGDRIRIGDTTIKFSILRSL